MAFEVRVPTLGESVTEGVITRWLKKEGESVVEGEVLLELETDKANMEIPAPRSGVVKPMKPEGETVVPGDLIAVLEDGAGRSAALAPARERSEAPPPPPPRVEVEPAPPAGQPPLSPAVRRLVEENRLEPGAIPATGPGGRLTKGDVVEHLERPPAAPPKPAPAQPPATTRPAPTTTRPLAAPAARPTIQGDGEEALPMSRIRKRIAERLVQAQHTAAILTTFNEVDMTAVMALRADHKDRFQKVHGVGLGFMSFFARASVAALAEYPAINAEIRGDDIVYKHFVHLGVAVGTERGLVVPVVHNAHQLSFAEIEREILRLAGLAREGRLSLDDLSGGTFTISNGGVYGSLMSTPILNPPQSGILGLHKIQKRAMVVDDQIVARPMMYLALSYDHRIVDGEQAVSFLVRVKERIEDPARLLLAI